MRARLGEPHNSIQKLNRPLEQATTPSLEALQNYNEGYDEMTQGHFLAAVPLFERAIALDANFAMAYYGMAMAFDVAGDRGRSVGFIRIWASGVVVVDDVASEAVERGQRCDPREISDHIGIGPHRSHRCEVAPLRVDDYVTLILGGNEARRNPAVELTDDALSIAPQELDELLLILRLNGQDVDKGGDLFRHRYCRVHDVLLQKALLFVLTP
jgi:tetratricopeptide (TPR) repeat protein